MSYLGDYDTSTVIYGKFTTFRPSTGAAYTLGGTPALSVYKDNSLTQSTTGVTLTADFDSVTGLNHFAIDTSADGTFYSAGSHFSVVITTGTVDSVSVVGAVVAEFSLARNSSLKPTTAGRKLDVTATGAAGIDWGNVENPTTTVGLSGTTVKTATDVETDTQDIQSRLPAALGANGNIKADVRDYNGTAGTFSGGRPEVNTSHWGGTAVVSALVRSNLIQVGGSATPVTNLGIVFETDFATNYNTTLDMWSVNTTKYAGEDVSTSLTGVPQVDVVGWGNTVIPVSYTAGYPIVTIKDGTGAGEINTNAGAIALVDLVTATTTVGSVTGAVGSVTGNVGGNVIGSVASVTGAVGSVTGNVGGNVVGSVASVTGNVGGNVVGSVASVTAAVAITSNIKKNQALAKFQFMMTDSTNHEPATGKTVTCTRSIDGAAFAAGTLANVTEVSNGMYTVDFGAGDLNGNVIVLRATATGCDDTFERLVSQP